MLPTRKIALSLIALTLSASVWPVCDAGFDDALQRSGYLHSPLHNTTGISLEDEAASKLVLDSMILDGQWNVTGSHASKVDGDTMAMLVNFDTGNLRAKGSPDDPDYATYGNAVAVLDLGGVSLDRFNRLCLVI